MCVPDSRYFDLENDNFIADKPDGNIQATNQRLRRLRVRKNPVQRAASRLYRAGIDLPTDRAGLGRNCVGPEFVVRAALPSKKLAIGDTKGSKKVVTVIMLNGQKLDVTCNPNCTTAGQLLELIIQKEHIEENFMLCLSALIAGDFVFLPSDTRICKVMHSGSNPDLNFNLFLRVRFFLPSLRGIKGCQARHLLYLQLRRSILEHQLPCSFSQIIELNGLALQSEFGNYSDIEHGSRDYFLLEHYVPETMACVIDDQKRLREELVKAHISKKGLEREKAEQDFIIFTQNLPHYGGHFYTATWMLKDNNNKEIWLYISAQGINLYERGNSATSHFGPQLYETFEWKSIQTLCYSKHYLCILPHSGFVRQRTKLKKYKLKMDHKKSYFAFRLASLHHQFFLRLRTEYTSLHTLSQQFGIPLKDIKNETNSLCKMDSISQPIYSHIDDYAGSINAQPEFRVDLFHSDYRSNTLEATMHRRKSRSYQDINNTVDETIIEEFQNKENEKPGQKYHQGLVLDSSYFAGLPVGSTERRRGVKMGTRAFANLAPRVSRSMEAVNEYLEQMSLQSVSLHCSSNSISKSSADGLQPYGGDAYVLDSTIKSVSQQNFLPNFQETINETLLEKLNNMSFAEERLLSTVAVERDSKGSLGLQITEGSDGNVYVQSVILGGPAHLSQGIRSGDQVIAVNGQSLLGRRYSESLELLKNTGHKVEFVLSRIVTSFQPPNKVNLSHILEDDLQISTTNSPVEKHLTESCHDFSNSSKYLNRSPVKDVSYQAKVHHQYKPETDNDNDRAVIVEMIPKKGVDWSKFPFDNKDVGERRTLPLDKAKWTMLNNEDEEREGKYVKKDNLKYGVPLPRSLGLSRKWKGPVRYPVTPVKKVPSRMEDVMASTSDDEQVFI